MSGIGEMNSRGNMERHKTCREKWREKYGGEPERVDDKPGPAGHCCPRTTAKRSHIKFALAFWSVTQINQHLQKWATGSFGVV